MVARWFRKYTYYLWSIVELLMGFENPLLIVRIFLKLAPGVQTVRLRRQGLTFKVRGAMDVWSLKETFLDRFYEKCGFAVQPGWRVIDIGAGTGDYTLFAATAASAVRVFAFEPFPGSFALLQENLQGNPAVHVQAFAEAIEAVSGEAVLDLSSGEPLQFQSRLEQDSGGSESLQVRVGSLESTLPRLGLEACDLLKLDCEGAEYSILMKSPPASLKQIKRIVMEYHDGLTHYNHADLARYLQVQGFVVEIFPNPVHAHLGYMRAAYKN